MKYLLFSICFIFNSALAFSNNHSNAQYGFIENKGQIIDQNLIPNKNVLFLYNDGSFQVQLKQNGFSYELIKKQCKSLTTGLTITPNLLNTDSFKTDFFVQRVDISFVNANPNVEIIKEKPSLDYLNFYTTATPENGIINVRHFKKIIYKNIYKNIDIEFLISPKSSNSSARNDLIVSSSLKYNFIIHPGANPDDIKLLFDGANKTSINTIGSIILETDFGIIEETIPLSYQISSNNQQFKIEAGFKQLSENTFGFYLKDYKPNQTLVIDPAPWATYYGGGFDDLGYGIAIDDSANVIITGITQSTNNIATSGAFKTTFLSFGSNNFDAFIAKMNSSGARLWATYYGQGYDDRSNSVACDTIGNILITGITNSPIGMATTGAYQTMDSGFYDAFIAKFNRNGHRIWATYFGGSGNENYGLNSSYNNGGYITSDRNCEVIISGATNSLLGISTLGAHQNNFAGGQDAFVAKFDSTGLILWATYYGGSGTENGINTQTGRSQGAITTDFNNNIILTGSTNSINNIATSNAYDTSFGGTMDAYIVKFNKFGLIQWATYYGGSNYDDGICISTDTSNNIIISGQTLSLTNISSPGAFQSSFGGFSDAFIAKFNSTGNREWASYFGGTGYDLGTSIIANLGGSYIFTGAAGPGLTTTINSSYSGNSDIYIAKVNLTGTNLIFSSYYGGLSTDISNGIVVDKFDNYYLSGFTFSSGGIATIGGFQSSLSGNADAFLAAFTSNGSLPVKWLNFSASLNNDNSVLLKWQTANEINNSHFIVERTQKPQNNNDWQAIGSVSGNGVTNLISNYQFIDQHLNSINFQKPIFYRLKQVDFDANFEYSKTVSVSLADISNIGMNIFPNPNSGSFSLKFETNSQKHINVFDVLGNLVLSLTTSEYLLSLDLPENAKGIYLINSQDSDGNFYNGKLIVE